MSKGKLAKRLETLSIGSINVDLEKFYVMVDSFCIENSKNDEIQQQQISRIIDLFRYSDALIDDSGHVSCKGNRIFRKLYTLKLSVNNCSKLDSIEHDIESLKGIRESLAKDRHLDFELNDLYNNVSWISNLAFNVLQKKSDNVNRKKANPDLSFENLVLEMTNTIKAIQTKSGVVSVRKIMKKKFKGHKNFSLNLNTIFQSQVEMWKYADAHIQGDKIYGITETAKAFRISNILNQENRQIIDTFFLPYRSKIHNSEDMRLWKIMTVIYGIGELLYNDNNIEMSDVCGSVKDIYLKVLDHNKWANEEAFGVPVLRWVTFLVDLKQVGENDIRLSLRKIHNNLFVKRSLKDLGRTYSKKEIETFKQQMTLSPSKSGDMFDAPLIETRKGDVLVFLPVLLELDPIYTLMNVFEREKVDSVKNGKMKSTAKWQEMKGDNFQKLVIKWLSKNGYTKYDSEVKSKKNGENELDIVVQGDNGNPIWIELKTFEEPHSYRDYRFQIDKMYSNKYLKHAKRNLNYFQQGFGNSKLKYTYKDGAGEKIFVSNLFIPSDYISDREITFVHEFELYRLIRKNPFKQIKMEISGTKYKPRPITSRHFNDIPVLTTDYIRRMADHSPFGDIFSNNEYTFENEIVNEYGDVSGKVYTNGFLTKVKAEYANFKSEYFF